MSELKTLKDLSSMTQTTTNHTKRTVIGIDDEENLIFDKPPEVRVEKLNFVSHEDLRKEAIKWIQTIKNYPDEPVENMSSLQEVINDAIIRWIKHFFNITDEELEDERKENK